MLLLTDPIALPGEVKEPAHAPLEDGPVESVDEVGVEASRLLQVRVEPFASRRDELRADCGGLRGGRKSAASSGTSVARGPPATERRERAERAAHPQQ